MFYNGERQWQPNILDTLEAEISKRCDEYLLEISVWPGKPGQQKATCVPYIQ